MTQVIPHKELAELVFGQQHILTEFFFMNNLGKYQTVTLPQFPHYHFLDKHLDDPLGSNIYTKYLEASWPYYYGKENITTEKIQDHLTRYISLYNEIKSKVPLNENAFDNPVKVSERPDGTKVIVDGNHRASIALKLGIDLKATFVPLQKQLIDVVSIPSEFYGTQRMDLPYQSICYRGEVLVQGRRIDIDDRINKIRAEDLENQTVLDLGCNVGANCFLSVERGATAAVGIEYSPKIATAAVRVNAYLNSNCYFIAHDLNKPLDGLNKFDTVFCFSVVDHLKAKEGLITTLANLTGKVLYFEGHAGSQLKDYEYLLNEQNFSNIELLGYGHDGVHSSNSTRPLYRCEVRNVSASNPFSIANISVEGYRLSAASVDNLTRKISTEINTIKEQLSSVVSKDEKIILVDDDKYRSEIEIANKPFSFIDVNGEYYGPPVDSETAIEETNRLRQQGAEKIVIVNVSFWWLQYYKVWADYLVNNFNCIVRNDIIIVYDLNPKNETKLIT